MSDIDYSKLRSLTARELITFKLLKTMIEAQAKWTEEDSRRLKVLN